MGHNMELPVYKELKINQFQQIFNNTTESYKFFWLKAIIKGIGLGKNRMTFDSLIEEMVCDAWYIVTRYHLNLGMYDTVAKVIDYISKEYGLGPNDIDKVKFVLASSDKEIHKVKSQLSKYVPYRLQTPFFDTPLPESMWEGPRVHVQRAINAIDGIFYRIDCEAKEKSIVVEDDWSDYIRCNYGIVSGWVQYKLINYLQRKNPNVPGIPLKLFPESDREMRFVRAFWNEVLTLYPINDIYSGYIIEQTELSIDHFIPWSYVAHDELWNLCPVTKRINSQKSDSLPNWDKYFIRLCDQQYLMRTLAKSTDKTFELFRACLKNNMNDDKLRYDLYEKEVSREEFINMMEKEIIPIYRAAQNTGFKSSYIYMEEYK